MNRDLLKQYLFVAIRYITPYAAGWVSTKFGITTADVSAWIATSLTIIMGVWALFNKAHYEAKLNTSLDRPGITDKATLKEVIASGGGTSATANK